MSFKKVISQTKCRIEAIVLLKRMTNVWKFYDKVFIEHKAFVFLVKSVVFNIADFYIYFHSFDTTIKCNKLFDFSRVFKQRLTVVC